MTGASGGAARVIAGFRLDEIRIPRKQRPYVFSKRFEIRYNTAFESVVRYYADPTRDPEGKTWILGGLIEGLVELHRRRVRVQFRSVGAGGVGGRGFARRSVRLSVSIRCSIEPTTRARLGTSRCCWAFGMRV